MASIRPLLLSLVLPASLVACGGDDDGGGTIVPAGPHHTYVASEISVPTNAAQARDFGLDLGGTKSNKLDGASDNQLGMVLGTLSGQGFDVQGTISKSVADGTIILLVDFQSEKFDSSSAAGLQVKLGDKATAMPAPCTDANDMVCGNHLKGNGSFTIAAGSPDNAAVAGKIVGGTFNGGPGTLSLQIVLGGTDPITLDLKSARAKATGITDTGIQSVILAGALTQDDLNTKVIPAIASQLGPLITRDCTMTSPPVAGCGCKAMSTGKTVIDFFDSNKDCMVTVDEIKMNQFIQSVLSPDVCTTSSCPDKPDALSLGIKVTAVGATIR